jgi:hypothetical protein
MGSIQPSRTLGVAIARPLAEAYDFLVRPENWPKWASGLGASLAWNGTEWTVQAPAGPARLRFTPRNEFGVLDHYVSPAPGVEVYMPMRVIANGAGCEVLLTVFRQPDMTDAIFARDTAWVERDLAALKQLLEGGVEGGGS